MSVDNAERRADVLLYAARECLERASGLIDRTGSCSDLLAECARLEGRVENAAIAAFCRRQDRQEKKDDERRLRRAGRL